MTRLVQVVVVASLASVMAPRVTAQVSHPRGVHYRLDDDATFQRGCFDPCACPMFERASVKGTFRLTPSGADPRFQYYAVDDVSFKVAQPDGSVLPIQGSGTFKIGGEFAIQEELSLDLVVGDDAVQHFDSGVVVSPVPFPRLDLTISIHGVFCFDTVIEVRAQPSPRLAVERYDLEWDPETAAAGYEVVRGDLGTLRATGGDYRAVTEECVANALADDWVPFPAAPVPGEAWWFLVRTEGGSYDAWESMLVAPRDAGIVAGSSSCP